MASYSVGDLIGHTLYAKRNMRIKTDASDAAIYDNSYTYRTVPAGEMIGIVYSWLDPRPGRTNLWWMFNDALTGQSIYAQHNTKDIDYQKTIGMGNLLSIEEKIVQQQEANTSTFEKVADKLTYGIIAFGVLKLASSLIAARK